MTAQSPMIREWLLQVHAVVGTRWFLFNELPVELRNKTMLPRASENGKLHRKRYCPTKDTRMWKVVM